jgi:hypothetical protein
MMLQSLDCRVIGLDTVTSVASNMYNVSQSRGESAFWFGNRNAHEAGCQGIIRLVLPGSAIPLAHFTPEAAEMPAEILKDDCTPEDAVELIRTTPANPTQIHQND